MTSVRVWNFSHSHADINIEEFKKNNTDITANIFFFKAASIKFFFLLLKIIFGL